MTWDDRGYRLTRPEGCTGRVGSQGAIDFTPTARELAQAVQNRDSKALKILARLRQGPANTAELAQIGGVRFGARILELRRAGHRIVTEERSDYALYRLEGER